VSRDPASGHDVLLLLADGPEDVVAAREAATRAAAVGTRVLAAVVLPSIGTTLDGTALAAATRTRRDEAKRGERSSAAGARGARGAAHGRAAARPCRLGLDHLAAAARAQTARAAQRRLRGGRPAPAAAGSAAGGRGADASECGRGSRRSAAQADSSWLAGKEQRGLIEATGTSMLTLNGIGPAGAARLLIDVGDNTRLPTKGHFASWNGTALLVVSPGTGPDRGVVCARDSHGTYDGFGLVRASGDGSNASGRPARPSGTVGRHEVGEGVQMLTREHSVGGRATTRVTGAHTVQVR